MRKTPEGSRRIAFEAQEIIMLDKQSEERITEPIRKQIFQLLVTA
jgi:hypothetical protein